MSSQVESGTAPGDTANSNSRAWWILAVLGLAQLMIAVDITIVTIAMPSAQRSLHFSNDDRLWVISAYTLAGGSLLLIGGRLGDRFGRKYIYLIGVTGFALASAFGGSAQNFTMLVIGRTMQGAFSALLAPTTLAIVSTTFTDATRRAKAFGIWGALAAVGAAAGLLVGGTVTQTLSWRWTLYINVPIGAAGLIGGLLLIPLDKTVRRPRIDIPGTITGSAGVFGIVFGFSRAQSHGWGASVLPIVLGAALLVVFVLIQTRVSDPLVPLRILTDRRRAGALIAIAGTNGTIYALTLFLTYFFQLSRGYSPLRTGVAFLPFSAVMFPVSVFVGMVLMRRFATPLLLIPGMLIAAGGLAILAQLKPDSGYWSAPMPGLAVMAFGTAFVLAPAMSAGTSNVEPRDAGAASALVNTTGQIAGSMGIAVLSTLAANASTRYVHARQPTADVLSKAAVHGYAIGFWGAAALVVGCAAIVVILFGGRARAPQAEPVEALAAAPASVLGEAT